MSLFGLQPNTENQPFWNTNKEETKTSTTGLFGNNTTSSGLFGTNNFNTKISKNIFEYSTEIPSKTEKKPSEASVETSPKKTFSKFKEFLFNPDIYDCNTFGDFQMDKSFSYGEFLEFVNKKKFKEKELLKNLESKENITQELIIANFKTGTKTALIDLMLEILLRYGQKHNSFEILARKFVIINKILEAYSLKDDDLLDLTKYTKPLLEKIGEENIFNFENREYFEKIFGSFAVPLKFFEISSKKNFEEKINEISSLKNNLTIFNLTDLNHEEEKQDFSEEMWINQSQNLQEVVESVKKVASSKKNFPAIYLILYKTTKKKNFILLKI